MPRKKQTVQTQKRRKVYTPGQLSGDATQVKPKGAFKVFSNYKLFAVIGAVVLIGGFGISAFYSNTSKNSAAKSVRGQGVTKATPEAGVTSVTGAQAAIKQYTAPPAMGIDPNKTYTATIKTEKGDIVVQLLSKEAPDAVNNFVFLANDHFYDGVTFFRVIPGFVAQTCDPSGTGSGGPGYELPFESTTTPVKAGTLAVAKPDRAGTANSGSQFFFALSDIPTQDGKATVFGTIVSGQDVLQQLQERDPQKEQDPAPGTRIDSVTVTSS
jgi:cyclophilin family peptidyl-prolyl cis-trans isomerase